MQIEVLEKDDVNLRLLVKGVDVPFMNALRRIVISEVPCMAVDEIVVLENSSVLQDEMIAHRLGLVPLKTDLDSYNLPEECECKSEFGCNLCRVTFTLDAESKEGTRPVYSGEMISENPNIVPVSQKIPLLKLAKEQKIRLEAYARLGKGKNHARWQPVSMCAYKYYPKIEISKTCDVCGKCIEACPRHILVRSEGKLQVKDVKLCTLCQDCSQACPKDTAAITITSEPETFILNVESSGVLPPERIVAEAAKILDKQLKELGSKVKKSEEA